MLDAYRRANLALRPPVSLRERTVFAMEKKQTPRVRSRGPRYVAALAAVLALAFLFSVMPRSSGNPNGGVNALRAYALSEPAYPNYPARVNNLGVEREGYWGDRRNYWAKIEPVEEEFVQKVGDFSGTTSKLVLAGAEENRLYSPVSFWIALAMLAETTGGESRQQVLDALGVDDLETLREQTRRLWQNLYRDDGIIATIPASSIWLSNGYSYEKETLDTLAEWYYAGSYAVDMGTAKADKAIAAWLDEQTGGLLKDSTGQIQTDPLDLFQLFSTIYYYGKWSTPFDQSRNTWDTFTRADGTEVTAEFMHTKREGSALLGETFTAASLYNENSLITFVLPDEGRTVDEVLADPGLWDGLAGRAEWGRYKTEWSLPKFDAQSDVDLKDTMKEMGITDLFDDTKADFTALVDPAQLDRPVLSVAKQAARIQVDEEGIRAVTYTQLGTQNGAALPPNDVIIMDLNRPFLVIIGSNSSGASLGDIPLFVGVVNDPSA